jgi:hypothetical protein
VLEAPQLEVLDLARNRISIIQPRALAHTKVQYTYHRSFCNMVKHLQKLKKVIFFSFKTSRLNINSRKPISIKIN